MSGYTSGKQNKLLSILPLFFLKSLFHFVIFSMTPTTRGMVCIKQIQAELRVLETWGNGPKDLACPLKMGNNPCVPSAGISGNA